MKSKVIKIDGVEYIKKKEDLKNFKKADELEGMEYIICRTYSAGVFAGYLQERNGQEVILRKARRLWYWSGAASLSQLAMEGVKKTDECKFPCEVDKVELMQAIEIISATKEAQESINNVKIWEE